MLLGPRDGVPPVAFVADRAELVDAGESVAGEELVDAGESVAGEELVDAGASVAGEDSDVGGSGADLFAPSDAVETSVVEVGAADTDGVTGASDEDACDEAATGYAGTPGPSATEPDLVDSGRDRPATSGPGGPYRAVVLSSRNEALASAEVPRLAEQGFSGEMIPVDIGDGGLWFRVVVRGGYPALDSALAVVEDLRRFGHDRAWVHKE